jgi:signal transduction histidine kinase
MEIEESVRVLLLANEFDSARIVIEESRSDTGLRIVETGSREEFYRILKDRETDVVVVESIGVPELPIHEVLDSADKQEIPVIVLGRDGDDGRDAVQELAQGAADYLPASHWERLPEVVRRVLREREMAAGREHLETELRSCYEALLENQRLVSAGRLAASIAHEINNPLEAVTNLLYLLRMESNLSAAAQGYIAAAELEMERVSQISKQTLNFHRETRRPVRVQPTELLEEVLTLYARRLEERHIEVVRQYRSEASLVIFPGEMRQVLSNLIANAIEATEVGGQLTLRIRRARKWPDQGITGIRIVVADNGCGISPETRRKLGQLFYTTKGQRGTGLGLWVTKAIIKRYGGDIHLYSSTREARHGTVFSIFLPANVRPLPVVFDSESIGSAHNHRELNGGDSPPDHKIVLAKDAEKENTGICKFKTRSFPPVAS